VRLNALPLVGLLVLCGCATTNESRLQQTSALDVRHVYLEQVQSQGAQATFRLVNSSRERLRYMHWSGQGPEPVAYCLRKDGTQCWCSTTLYLIGDDATGYEEWTHDTFLRARGSALMHANIDGMSHIGVKIYVEAPFREVVVWFSLAPSAPNISLQADRER
jgi:hypothetical protein